MKKWIILIVACILIPSAVVFSQDESEDATADAGTPPGPGGEPGTPVPLDGGVSLLVAAGIGYGAKKAYDAKKKAAADEDKDGNTSV